MEAGAEKDASEAKMRTEVSLSPVTPGPKWHPGVLTRCLPNENAELPQPLCPLLLAFCSQDSCVSHFTGKETAARPFGVQLALTASPVRLQRSGSFWDPCTAGEEAAAVLHLLSPAHAGFSPEVWVCPVPCGL